MICVIPQAGGSTADALDDDVRRDEFTDLLRLGTKGDNQSAAAFHQRSLREQRSVCLSARNLDIRALMLKARATVQLYAVPRTTVCATAYCSCLQLDRTAVAVQRDRTLEVPIASIYIYIVPETQHLSQGGHTADPTATLMIKVDCKLLHPFSCRGRHSDSLECDSGSMESSSFPSPLVAPALVWQLLPGTSKNCMLLCRHFFMGATYSCTVAPASHVLTLMSKFRADRQTHQNADDPRMRHEVVVSDPAVCPAQLSSGTLIRGDRRHCSSSVSISTSPGTRALSLRVSPFRPECQMR